MNEIAKLQRLLATGALSLVFLGALSATAFAQIAESWPEPIRVVYPGEVIVDDMLIDVPPSETTTGNLKVTDRGQVVGKVARRTLLPHHPIAMSAVAEKALISSGRTVEASYIEGALLIIAKVMALQDGRPGELVQVRSMDGGKIIEGIVQSDGSVRIPVQ
jgi:flagellar basal body P-ring formation protein FlgA